MMMMMNLRNERHMGKERGVVLCYLGDYDTATWEEGSGSREGLWIEITSSTTPR
jgi:hypothetical protein